MVKKQDKKTLDAKKEVAKLLEGTPKGFRKGMTKKELVKSLTDEDWERIDQDRRAQELHIQNKSAYKLALLNDQLLVEKNRLVVEIREAVTTVLELKNMQKKAQVDIMVGETPRKHDDGESVSIEELKIEVMKIDTQIAKARSILRNFLGKLYTYVGRIAIGGSQVLTEESYDNQVRWVEEQLKQASVSLFD